MPAIRTTIELPIELEYSIPAEERGSSDGWGAPLEPDQPAAPELVAATVLSPALEARGLAWGRTPPRRPGWYWLRRGCGEAMIRRVVEVPLAVAGRSPAGMGGGVAPESAGTEAIAGELQAAVALATCASDEGRRAASPPAASILIVLEPGEGPRSARHVPVAAYTQVWQWAGPIPTPGAAMAVTVNLAKLDGRERERFLGEILEVGDGEGR